MHLKLQDHFVAGDLGWAGLGLLALFVVDFQVEQAHLFADDQLGYTWMTAKCDLDL